MISSYHGSTCRYWRVPLLNCRSFDMPDIVVVFVLSLMGWQLTVWVLLAFVLLLVDFSRVVWSLLDDGEEPGILMSVCSWCGFYVQLLICMWYQRLYICLDLLRVLGGGVVSWCFWVMCVQAFPLSKRYIGGTAIHICPLLRDVFSCHLFFLRYCCFLETLYFRLCALSVHTYWYLHTVWDTCYFYLHLSK